MFLGRGTCEKKISELITFQKLRLKAFFFLMKISLLQDFELKVLSISMFPYKVKHNTIRPKFILPKSPFYNATHITCSREYILGNIALTAKCTFTTPNLIHSE